jgi:ATP-dependent Clp protease protease subunit
MGQYTIPTVVERSSRGERAYDIYSRLLSERIVFLGTEINDDVANVVIAQLLHLQAESAELEIGFYINSRGGSYSALTAIYDTMQYVRPDIATFCVGQASSAAAVLLAAGTPGKRSMLKHAKVMLHQPSTEEGWFDVAQGTLPDLAIRAKDVGPRQSGNGRDPEPPHGSRGGQDPSGHRPASDLHGRGGGGVRTRRSDHHDGQTTCPGGHGVGVAGGHLTQAARASASTGAKRGTAGPLGSAVRMIGAAGRLVQAASA